ncbi:transketolase [Desulfatibacillum aliphaticivorans]|uniref:Transketolase, subunit A n=1 Tax=Desulfatibacillum aliphaticivorans TaxID=218208 RepID=B8FK93_DESAL|nr:transketolase [Desulfatibacillum aliphaticivorans]ACL02768.1 Transketolase, subunit A [Desulfatibacillum aliphaticivorans]
MALSTNEIKDLEQHAWQARQDIIDITGWSGGAHIGGGLSVTDILVIMYFKYLNVDPKNPQWEDRDRFIMSKGHAGVAYAPVLARKGYFNFDDLQTFNKFKSPFGMHLDCLKVKGVDVSTGSLGHGLSIAVGLALGARLQKKDWYTYCVLGDGECNEGSVWEAAMSASHFKLNNLVTFVDRNRLMIDGKTEDVMGLEPFADKWKAFGFIVKEVDGHDFNQLAEAIDFAKAEKSGPVVIIANTAKGKGVDFMENEVKWHYGGLDTDLRAQAKASVDKMYGKA